MRLIITDTPISPGPEDMLITEGGTIHGCKGCFSCWLRTPGVCCLTDSYRSTGIRLSKCSELLIISRCLFGGYSPFIKNVLDRSISYVLPFFDTSKGDMRHKRRYKNALRISALFYGDAEEDEKNTARDLVRANARNMLAEVGEISFVSNIGDREVKL